MVRHLFLLRSDLLTALGGSSYSTYFTSLNGKHFGQHDRLRWTESALRAARRRGLKLLRCGKRKYVSGREIVRFLEELQEDT